MAGVVTGDGLGKWRLSSKPFAHFTAPAGPASCAMGSSSAQPSRFHDQVVPELCLSLPDGGTRATYTS